VIESKRIKPVSGIKNIKNDRKNRDQRKRQATYAFGSKDGQIGQSVCRSGARQNGDGRLSNTTRKREVHFRDQTRVACREGLGCVAESREVFPRCAGSAQQNQ